MKSGSSRHFRIVSRKSAFRGKLTHLDLLQIKTRSGKQYERELIKHPGAAVIIPRLSDGRLILIKQLRVAIGENIWEFPAGTLEKGESPVRCAARELQEETGWKAGKIRELVEFFPTPGISNERMIIFLAENLKRAAVQNPDIDEELEVHTFSAAQVDRMIRTHQIIDGKTILGFLFYEKYFA